MKKFTWFLLLSAALLVVSCSKSPSVSKVWSSKTDLTVVESVMFDSKNSLLYASCINGKPAEKNGKGFIAQVGLDGKIIKKEWATGFNAPKGMGIVGTSLFVADIDRIHKVNIATGKIVKTYTVPGAGFLNDIAVGSAGEVYITDTRTAKVHLIKDGKLSDWLILKDYGGSNGLYIKGDTLYVGTGQGLLAVITGSKMVKLIVPLTGGIDGLKSLGDNSFIVSDWKGKVQVISVGKKPVVVLDTSKDKINAADFEYIAKTKMIYIPTFFANRIDAYKIK